MKFGQRAVADSFTAAVLAALESLHQLPTQYLLRVFTRLRKAP
jgi:hypothetical protein